jgi:hypothetical protein
MFNNQITKAYFDAGAQRNIKCTENVNVGFLLKNFPQKKKEEQMKNSFAEFAIVFISIGHKGKNDILEDLNTFSNITKICEV